MLLEKLSKFINQFTTYYQSVVGISFYKTDIHVVEIKKRICELIIINSKCYENSENVFKQINTDFNLKDKKIAVNFYTSSGLFKLHEITFSKNEICPFRHFWISSSFSKFIP